MAAVEPGPRNQSPVDEGATGASQSLLDRKEVLGGESSFKWVGGDRLWLWGSLGCSGVKHL